MKNIRLLLFFVVTSGFSQGSINEQMTTYLNLNGTVHYYSEVVDRMFDFMKKEYEVQQVPEEVWTELAQVKGPALEDITELIIQSYEGHFTQGELQEMLVFYQTETGKRLLLKEALGPEDVKTRDRFYASPLGQKINSATDSLNTVLQKITQEWSAQLFRDVTHKLREKGYTKGK